jgi:predicted secreted protein
MKQFASSSKLVRRIQALADLAMTDFALRPAVRSTVEAAMIDGAPAMRARGRALLARWPQDAAESGTVSRVGAGETSCA